MNSCCFWLPLDHIYSHNYKNRNKSTNVSDKLEIFVKGKGFLIFSQMYVEKNSQFIIEILNNKLLR